MTSSINAKSRRRLRPLALLAVGALLLAACGEDNGDTDPAADAGDEDADDGGEPDEVHELVVANFTHGESPETSSLEWLLTEIEDRSEGRIEFERFHQEALCAGPEITECIRDGRADLGMTVTSYTEAEFPIAEIWSVPFLTTDLQAIIQSHDALLDEEPAFQQEMENIGIEPLYFFPADRALMGGTEPINSIDDLQGQSVRTVGEGSLIALEQIGANPVAVTAAEMYESMQRGVIDIWLNNISGNATYSMYEVGEYWADPGIGVYTGLIVGMNPQTFDGLGEDLQEIILEVRDEWVEGQGFQVLEDVQQDNCDAIAESGQVEEWDIWDEAQVQEWQDAAGDAPAQAWIDNAAAAGVEDPEGVLDTYRDLVADFEDPGRDFVAEECAEQATS